MGRGLMCSNQPWAAAHYICNHSGRVDAITLKALLSASARSCSSLGHSTKLGPLKVEVRFNNARPQGHYDAIYTSEQKQGLPQLTPSLLVLTLPRVMSCKRS